MDPIFIEGLRMTHYAVAYDLVYNLKSWTPAEHKQIHDDFFYPIASTWLYPAGADVDKENSGGCYMSSINNRSMHALAGLYAMAVVTNDKELIDAALYGTHTDRKTTDNAEFTHFPPRKDWYVATPDNPGHGILNSFFSEKAIPGGMWVEGTPSYAFYALGSMLDVAEIAWHHGIDLYRHNNGIFKSMFDFSILLGYPDLTTPGLNDAHRGTLLSGAVPTIYEYAYRRYKDPRYLAMINPPEEKRFLARIADPTEAAKVEDELIHPPQPGTPPPPPLPPGAEKPAKTQRSLAMQSSRFGGNPPSFMFDLAPDAGATIVPAPSVNYPIVGFGIIRTPSVNGKMPQGVILSYGPSASHGHPDKLAIDLFALDDVLMPSPGVNFPYQGNIRLPKWYHTTIAHNDVTVDEKSQEVIGNNQRTMARADQTVYAPAATVGMQRAWTASVYPNITPNVTLDRAVFMTPHYLADIYGAFSAAPHKYDFAWHIRGEAASSLTFNPITFDQSINGYNWFTSARAAESTDKAVKVSSTQKDKVARLHLAGGVPTQIIIGEGGIYVDETAPDPKDQGKPTCPTIIQRRDKMPSTIYGNALDFSNDKDGYVKDVAQEGSLDVGYGILKVTTKAGVDLCFAAYRPGNYSSNGLQTDGQQAFVAMNGKEPQALCLAGGKSLSAGEASISRSDSGLAFVEKTSDGNYIVGNPSPTDATITVKLSALKGLEAFALDANNQKGAPVIINTAGGAINLPMKAGAKVLFAKK